MKKILNTFFGAPLKCWNHYKLYFTSALAAAAFYMGFTGFSEYFRAANENKNIADLIYLTVQLFALESGNIPGNIPWQLEIARFLAPAITAYAAFEAVTILFYEQIQILRAGFYRDHIVICGLGHKGMTLAKKFNKSGERVIVIDYDDKNPFIDKCRECGITVLIGDVTDSVFLMKARVDRAKILIAACGEDSVNAEVAVNACCIVKDRNWPVLTCYVHIFDDTLCNLLKEREISAENIQSFRLQFFNSFDQGARVMLDKYPPFDPKATAENKNKHFLVIGAGRNGQRLIWHICRMSHFYGNTGTGNLKITIIDREAFTKLELLQVRYPCLKDICDFKVLQFDVCSPEFNSLKFLSAPGEKIDLSCIYICLDNDSLALSSALIINQKVKELNIPVILRMGYSAGLAAIINGIETRRSDNLKTFALFDEVSTPEVILNDTHETLAKAIHDEHRINNKNEFSGDNGSSADKAMKEWHELSEEFKESNRLQEPLKDFSAAPFEFKTDEIERLAQMEHSRWVQERIESGWKYSAFETDRDKKIHRSLVEWSKLDESEKEKNRTVIKMLPKLLAKIGFQIYRINTGRKS